MRVTVQKRLPDLVFPQFIKQQPLRLMIAITRLAYTIYKNQEIYMAVYQTQQQLYWNKG
jgi:hypothetical protein